MVLDEYQCASGLQQMKMAALLILGLGISLGV